MPDFTRYLPEKNTFSQILRAIPGSKADSERTRPQQYTHRFTGAIVLNKPFMCLRTLLHSISLDA